MLIHKEGSRNWIGLSEKKKQTQKVKYQKFWQVIKQNTQLRQCIVG